jgi:outer membrane immunogenic protein
MLFSASLLALVAASGGAFAADIPRAAPSYKAPVMAPVYNWTGFYVGINGGGGWGNTDWEGQGSGNLSGALVGLTLGYNWQALGSPWVFGLEGDIDWTNIRGTVACPVTGGCETRNQWLGTVRGRIGYAIDRVMPYVTGGLAIGDVRASQPGFGGVNETKAGWTLGAGVEAAIAPQWTAKIEYLYVDLGSVGCGAGACALPTNVDFQTHLVRGGVNFRF